MSSAEESGIYSSVESLRLFPQLTKDARAGFLAASGVRVFTGFEFSGFLVSGFWGDCPPQGVCWGLSPKYSLLFTIAGVWGGLSPTDGLLGTVPKVFVGFGGTVPHRGGCWGLSPKYSLLFTIAGVLGGLSPTGGLLGTVPKVFVGFGGTVPHRGFVGDCPQSVRLPGFWGGLSPTGGVLGTVPKVFVIVHNCHKCSQITNINCWRADLRVGK